MLFSETLLSSTGEYSCASCHQPQRHFTDGRARALGATGELHQFNTPTLYNVAFNASFGWTDSGLDSLESQHLVPLYNQHPVEMGYQPGLLQKLLEQPAYAHAFQQVFAEPASTSNMIKAIAAYVRTIRAPVSAFDRYLFFDITDDFAALQQHGMELFFSARLGCTTCHASLNFSGPVQHVIQQAPAAFHITGVGGTTQAFRAPSLRQIANTAPYMHDGSLTSLTEVLHHYETVSAPHVPDFALSDAERSALIAFLQAL